MKHICQHIRWWMFSLLLLLLTACSGGSADDTTTPPTPDTPDNATLLDIGVQSLGVSTLTRAGNIDASDAENQINSLQIWVFESGSNTLVAYLNPTNYPSASQDMVYQTNVTPAYANKTPKPNVDVYVMANAASVGLGQSLSETSTRSQLEEAVIGTTYFGPQTTISTDGLPMSGVLHNKAVVSQTNKPVLRITNFDNMEKVSLTRAVSKVRFVFCRPAESTDLSITGVGINANMIPNQEYVFLGTDGRTFRVGSSYNTAAISLPGTSITADNIAVCRDASKYFYTSQGAQEYEDLINKGVSGEGANATNTPELTQVGPFYFRETDKKLGGTISYDAGGEKSTDFSIQASGDFSRNRSWIVFAYYEGLTGLQINVVDVTQWEDTESNHEVYNW